MDKESDSSLKAIVREQVGNLPCCPLRGAEAFWHSATCYEVRIYLSRPLDEENEEVLDHTMETIASAFPGKDCRRQVIFAPPTLNLPRSSHWVLPKNEV